MMISRQCCAMVALCVLAATAAAQGVDHAREYEACIALTFRNADEALSAAQAWQKRGGGLPAEHCAALALLEAGRLEAAAQRLEALASRLPPSGGPVSFARFLTATSVVLGVAAYDWGILLVGHRIC